MATVYLAGSANLSAAVWRTAAGGGGSVTTLTSADTIDLDGNTLTVDQDLTCVAIIGTTGTLSVSGSRTITANMVAGGWSGTWNAAQTINVVGDGTAVGASRITVSGASTVVNWTGNLTGGSSGTSRAINCSGGTVTLTGNCTGGSASNCSAIAATGSGAVVTVNGTVTGGGTANVGGYGAQVTAGVLNINGTISGGSAASNTSSGNNGVLITGGTLNHVGNRVDTATSSAVNHSGGTDNWTQGSGRIGGRNVYPRSILKLQ